MRSFLRNFLLNMLSIGAKPSPFVHILNGHFFEKTESELSENEFDIFIENLTSCFNIIGLDEAVTLIAKNINVDYPKLSLTFDDGFEECYTKMLPVFEKHNIKATFFINPMSIENHNMEFVSHFIQENLKIDMSKKFMTWNMIREIQSLGHTIGSHSDSHANLKGLSSIELKREIIDSKEAIENATGQACKYFAFPFGNKDYFDQNSIDVVNSTYQYAFTSGLYGKYFFEDNRQILSRRHFESYWPFEHIKYFTSRTRV